MPGFLSDSKVATGRGRVLAIPSVRCVYGQGRRTRSEATGGIRWGAIPSTGVVVIATMNKGGCPKTTGQWLGFRRVCEQGRRT
eukprot:1931555-Pleurochrysis_carterae.AAC.1